jgi:hypothetical protein
MKRKPLLTGLSALALVGAALSSCNSAGASSGKALGPSCAGGGSDTLCIGVNYVSYTDSSGAPVASQDLALHDIEATNDVWKQCGIQFQIESYQAVDPTKYGLDPGAGAANQTDQIRDTFNDGNSFLIVQTGYWGTVKNAWTNLPGSAPYGAVFESTVADYPQIVAHELGHYLGLDHVDDPADVMDAIIYPDSTQLSQDQCDLARATAQDFWANMLRS